MLQRIQTVFLALVVVLMILMTLFPLWTYQSPDGSSTLILTSFYLDINEPSGANQVYSPYIFIAVLALASVLVAAIEIFQFKNRLLQMKLGALNSLLMAGAMGLGLYLSSNLMEERGLEVGWGYDVALFFPAAAMICNVIANRFIRKDERLVRSVDRIR